MSSRPVALVTGSARRLGAHVAVYLAQRGWDVAVHYRESAEPARAVARQVQDHGARCILVRADLRDPQAACDLVDRVLADAGRIDALVNNASTFGTSTLDTVEPADLVAELQVNTAAPLVLSRTLMRRCGSGSIVHVLDSRITSYDRDHVAYHLAKRALAALTSMMAAQWAPAMRVNAVAPGFILPPAGAPADYADRRMADIPLRRQGTPDEVAHAVHFLLTNGFVTGQIIYVDGGRHLAGAFYP